MSFRNLILVLIFTPLLIGSTFYHNTDPNEEVEAIHKTILTLDTHVDTPMRLGRDDFDIMKRNNPRRGGGKLDFPRMREGGLDAAFFAVFVPQNSLTEANFKRAYERAHETFDLVHEMAEIAEGVAAIALSPDDAYEHKLNGKHSIFIGLENGFPLEYDISRVQEFYDRGARYIGLSHTRNNQICDSSTDPNGYIHNGLSEFGREVVREMNRIGMMIDVSHISDQAFFDVLEISEHPVVATHSNARTVCDHPRNLSDEMLKAMAENGGVVQVTFLPSYVKQITQKPEVIEARRAVREKYNNFQGLSEEEMAVAWAAWEDINHKYPVRLPTVSDFVDHIDYIVDLIGIDHVGIGSDFDGGGVLEDCFDVSEMKNITAELLERNYSWEAIEKIWGGNFMRVFREVERLAGK